MNGLLCLKDYEEDFEEMDESANESENETEPQRPDVDEEREEIRAQRRKEIEAIQRAMDEENERVGTAQSRQNTSREEEDGPNSSRGTFISLVSSTKISKALDVIAYYSVPRFVFTYLT